MDRKSTPESNILLVIATTTFAAKQHAADMATRLLEHGVAACVQIEGPIESHYVWEQTLHCDIEWRLTIKTTTDALERVETIVLSTHPYVTPQWIVVTTSRASEPYRDWVASCVTPSQLATIPPTESPKNH